MIRKALPTILYLESITIAFLLGFGQGWGLI